ncbi:MAG: hypothetical protein QM691_06055 [Opitutaceae bacterium]
MKPARRTLRYALFTLLAAALLAALLLTSPVQTLFARAFLAKDPDLQYFIESLSAGFGRVELTDLRLRKNNIVLKLPSVRAQLPVYPAAARRQLRIETLVAKGWTLDLANRADLLALPSAMDRPIPVGNGAPLPEAVALRSAADVLAVLLARRELPLEVSIAALEFEGDIILPGGPGAEPIRLHVKLTGNDLLVGSGGRLVCEASTEVHEPRALIESAQARGSFAVGLDTARSFRVQSAEFDATFRCRHVGPDRLFTLRGAVATAASGPSLTLALNRGARHLASLQLNAADGGAMSGNWAADLIPADVPAHNRPRELPEFSASGSGTFQVAPDLTQLHATGALHAEVGDWKLPALGSTQVGQFAVDAQFSGVRDRSGMRVDALTAKLAGPGVQLSARALQPFGLAVDAELGVFPTEAGADWLALTLHTLALDRLPPPPAQLVLRPASVAGTFTLRTTAAGHELRTLAPLVGRDVTVTRAGYECFRGVDFSIAVSARSGPSGWGVQLDPINVTQAGTTLVSGTLGLQPSTLTASWRADLATIAPPLHQPAVERLGLFAGKLTATRGATARLDGEFSLQTSAPDRTITASVQLESYAAGAVDLRAPIEIVSGGARTDLVLEGGIRPQRDGSLNRQFNLGGRDVVLDDLGAVAVAALALRDLLTLPGDVSDRPPWRDWDGRVALRFEQVHASGTVLKAAHATLLVTGNTVRLEDGEAQLASGQSGRLNGSLVFTPGSAQPYDLAATATVEVVNAARFFPAPHADAEPLVEGCFALTDTLSCSAANLAELPHRLRGRLQLVGGTGVVRLLKTNLGGTTPDKAKPVSDALVTGTSAVVSLFGVKGDSIDSGQKSVGRGAAATRSFNYELGAITYERGKISAVHEPDGAIRVESIELTAPDLRLTGAGEIAAAPGTTSFVQQPFRAALRLAARGRVGEFLATSGLGEATADKEGFRFVAAPLELGGTLAQIDTSRWREVLVAALKRSK